MKPGDLIGDTMNGLYHLAILEGYLSQHAELPRNVQDAIAHLKQLASPLPVSSQVVKPRKKTKRTPEQRQKQLEHLEEMRAKHARFREEQDAAFWTEERKSEVSTMRKDGLTGKQIAARLPIGEAKLYKAIAKFNL